MPDWQPIVDTYLARFATVTSADVDRTEHWATNASMFEATGTWRAKVVRGELFVKFIRAHSHWAERTSVLRIVMLALDGLRREGVSLPDFEFVYAHNDKDPTPDSFPKCPRHLPRRRRRGKTRGAEPLGELKAKVADQHAKDAIIDDAQWKRSVRTLRGEVENGVSKLKPSEPPCVGAPIPLFTNARAVRHGDGAIGGGGLPLPDFTWVGWGKQPPWCQLSAQLRSEAARHGQWSARDARAIFSGGLDNGPDRKELRRLVRQRGVEARRVLRVRDTEAGKWYRWAQFDRTNRTEGAAAKRPPLPLSSVCAHRYALSLSGFGYSSRLRALLMCGATVVHVHGEDAEFFMPALVPGKHLVVLEGRDAGTLTLTLT